MPLCGLFLTKDALATDVAECPALPKWSDGSISWGDHSATQGDYTGHLYHGESRDLSSQGTYTYSEYEFAFPRHSILGGCHNHDAKTREMVKMINIILCSFYHKKILLGKKVGKERFTLARGPRASLPPLCPMYMASLSVWYPQNS